MSEPLFASARLHPASLVSHSLRLIPQFALGGAGYAALVEQQGAGRVLSMAAFAIGIGVILTLAGWWRFTYRVAPGEIVIEQGVLMRQRRVIPFNRVQDISIERGLLSRLFGTARVRIETGGSAAVEGDLDSIALADAYRIRDIVRGWNRGAEPPAAVGAEEPVLFRMSLWRVLGSGLFNFSLVFLAVLFGALQYLQALTGVDLYDPRRWAIPAEAAAGAATVQVTLIIVFVLLWLAGLVAGVLRTLARDYGFTLTRSEAGLRRRRGLFTLSEVVIPIRRTQVAAIDGGLLMRVLGWYRLSFQTLGANRTEGGLQVAAPFGRMEEALPILAEPGFPGPPPPDRFSGMPKRALIRRTAAPLTLCAVLGIAATAWNPALALPALVPLALAVLAALRLRAHRYALGERAVFVSGGLINRRLWIVPFEKLQTLEVSRSMLQRPLRLATLSIDTAGASPLRAPSLIDLDSNDAEALAERLLRLFHARRASARMKLERPETAVDARVASMPVIPATLWRNASIHPRESPMSSSTPALPPGQALQLHDLITPTAQGIASRVLARTPAGNVTLFALDAGQGLTEHTSPFDALVLVLEGALLLTIDGEPVRAVPGAIVRMPAHVPHAVEAPEPARMLLLMLRHES